LYTNAFKEEFIESGFKELRKLQCDYGSNCKMFFPVARGSNYIYSGLALPAINFKLEGAPNFC